MKKLLLSIFAVAALFSCSKSDITFDDEPTQIGFSPVANNISKSVANSTNTTGQAYPIELDLYVFANSQDDNLSASWPDTYLNNALFEYKNGVYAGTPAYYWPNVKTLIFSGYSGNIGTANASMNFSEKILTITNYTQDNTKGYTTTTTTTTEGTTTTTTLVEGGNDLMWFPTTSPYAKQTAAIPVTMKHACSWITVKVKSDGKYSGLKLHDLTINGLHHTGTATCGETSATWVVSGVATTENLYLNTAGADVSSTEAIFENTANNMIVIPQTPTSINVKYSYVPQEGVAAITETKTNLPLKLNDDNSVKWESGKHYIYTITITATEILIDPKVDVWDDQVVNPGTTI